MLYRIKKVNGGILDGMLYESKETVERLIDEINYESESKYVLDEIPYHRKPGVSTAKAVRILSERMFEYDNDRTQTVDLSDILDADV